MHRVHCCDNLELLRQQPDDSIDLIYIDPPFCTGLERLHSRTSHAYEDRWCGGLAEFQEFLKPRLEHMRRVLQPGGTIYVHLDWHAVHYVKVLMDRIFGYGNFLNEVIWHYRTGGVSKRWFGRKHDMILVYTKTRGLHTFNVQRDGSFRTEGLMTDVDGRSYKSTRKGRLYFNKEGPTVTDVWDIPFLSTVGLERTGYPSQKPKALLRRIIAASSDTGQLVADFFCGSGTALVVAQEMNRAVLGCDINAQAVSITKARLTEQAAERGSKSEPDAAATLSRAPRLPAGSQDRTGR